METNRDHSVVFEIASKYCILDSIVDHNGYCISSEGFLPAVVDIMVFPRADFILPTIRLLITLSFHASTSSNVTWEYYLPHSVVMRMKCVYAWLVLRTLLSAQTVGLLRSLDANPLLICRAAYSTFASVQLHA